MCDSNKDETLDDRTDAEIVQMEKSKSNERPDSQKLDCVYRSCGEREVCDICNEAVYIGENGFLTCSNKSCGIIYSDSLDLGAEWRFYGAEDSQNSDPTRCGMPINPLLKESSYGCKVICGSSSSYEMRKLGDIQNGNLCLTKKNHNMMNFRESQLWRKNAGIPKVIIDEALRYHKKLSEHKTFAVLIGTVLLPHQFILRR